MTKEKQTEGKKDNNSSLVSEDAGDFIPKEYLNKPIKPKRPAKKSGILLEDKYAKLIRARKKKEIISTENLENYVGKEIYLCGKGVYGSIILNEPMKLDRGQLKNHKKRHLITDYDINRLWPDGDTFYAHSFRINNMLKKSSKYMFNSIKSGIIDNIELVNKTGISKMRDLNNLNREHDNKLKEEKERKEQVAQEEVVEEEQETLKSNSRLDKYHKRLNSLKSLEFGGKYKESAILFLALYELYLEKGNSKIYDKNGIVLKPAPDITANWIRARIRNPKTIVEGSFRTITISASQGIKAVIGKLRKNPTGSTVIQSVLFDKKKWSTKDAMAWVKEHKESLKTVDSDEFKEKREEEKASPKKVKVEEKIETAEIWICPHCDKEIGEKELYCNEKTDEWFHRPCIEKGPIELPKDARVLILPVIGKKIEKRAEEYVDSGYVSRDKDKGKPEEKWVWCENCYTSFDYYKQLLNDESTVVCPNCGALVIFEEKD